MVKLLQKEMQKRAQKQEQIPFSQLEKKDCSTVSGNFTYREEKAAQKTQQVKQAAAQMYRTVQGLKEQLAEMDERVEQYLRDVQRTTATLTQELSKTEKELQRLTVQANHFPTAIPARNKTDYTRKIHNTLQTAKTELADTLLETVNRMLENSPLR